MMTNESPPTTDASNSSSAFIRNRNSGRARATRQNAESAELPAKTESTNAEFSANLNLALLEIATGELNQEDLRKEIRSAAMQYCLATGVGHVKSDGEGQWDIRPNHRTGRLPRRNDFFEKLAGRCDIAARTGSIQIDPLPDVEGCYGIMIPVLQFGNSPEILLAVINEKTDTHQPVIALTRIGETLQAALTKTSVSQDAWKLNSLAAMIELISQVETKETLRDALSHVINEVARHLNAGSVAITYAKEKKLGKVFVSGSENIDPRSSGYHGYQQCLAESLLRDNFGIWPAPNDSKNGLLLAHRQLASELNEEAVLSQPLTTVEGKTIGAWAFTGSRELLESPKMQRFINAVTPRIANSLQVVKRAEHPLVIRAIKSLPNQLKKSKIRIGIAICAMLLGMMFVPVEYKVRCNCLVEPSQRRFAVAPFDGTVMRGLVRPGDQVKEDDLLAEMDGRALRYEMASVTAELNSSNKKRAIELADGNIPEMMLAELDRDRLVAEQNLLEFKKQHLQVRSPITGIVLSGSLERAEAATVQTGEVLFEIGTTSGQVIQVEIPSHEIVHVKPGFEVTIWIEGRSDSIRGVIDCIRSRSELRNSKNVFIAEIKTKDGSFELRPGMKGAAKIVCESHALGWNLFHKPYEYVRSRLSW